MVERISHGVCTALAGLVFGILVVIWLPFALVKVVCLLSLLILHFNQEFTVAPAWDDPVTTWILDKLGIYVTDEGFNLHRVYVGWKSDNPGE